MGFLKAVMSFLPNLLTHHEAKPALQSSETWAGLIGLLGVCNAQFHWIAVGDWDKAVVPALTYAAFRFLSKGLKPAA